MQPFLLLPYKFILWRVQKLIDLGIREFPGWNVQVYLLLPYPSILQNIPRNPTVCSPFHLKLDLNRSYQSKNTLGLSIFAKQLDKLKLFVFGRINLQSTNESGNTEMNYATSDNED